MDDLRYMVRIDPRRVTHEGPRKCDREAPRTTPPVYRMLERKGSRAGEGSAARTMDELCTPRATRPERQWAQVPVGGSLPSHTIEGANAVS